MKKYENLSVKFKTDKDNYPYAWLESKSMAGFKLRLNQAELTWIMKYLKEEIQLLLLLMETHQFLT